MLRRTFAAGVPLVVFASIAMAAVPVSTVAAKARPNVVFIVADDLDAGILERFADKFPNITALAARGATFSRFYATNPWCCPSRASILRSQYVHSHGVLSNRAPTGGFVRFRPLEKETIATWMDDAGYRTALFGKYLNQYPKGADPTYIPPGWDEWASPIRNLYREYDYTLNDNGKIVEYGEEPEAYLTDVLAAKAAEFVQRDDPFFLYLSPTAPHRPANFAPRHEAAFPDAQAPRGPSWDQADLSVEPHYLHKRKRLSEATMADLDQQYRDRLRSTLGLDDLVGTVTKALDAAGKLANTYVFFTSDNGFHLGEHRLRGGKTTPFEEDIRVPMYVAGPGITPGTTTTALGSTVDFGATFADIAKTPTPAISEGRSLLPVLAGGPVPWRDALLVEFQRPPYADGGCPPSYAALRTADHTYVEYATGERQLYDNLADPHQLHNLVGSVDRTLQSYLASRLGTLRTCSGASCRKADTAVGDRPVLPAASPLSAWLLTLSPAAR
ncbi:sulfatase family protein [Herbidospora daliensis]|uniref:sulfatase family protein n=1 Tax=Herbidospora daliensis TaxID=295585 RepID=UPI000784D074|nr:sulfatase [Herbidospora daliensis]